MINRRRIARLTGHTTIALSIGFALCFAMYTLGPAELHARMDAPMAFCFWSYLALTPIAGSLAVSLGERRATLQRFVRCLVALWGVIFLAILLIPFA